MDDQNVVKKLERICPTVSQLASELILSLACTGFFFLIHYQGDGDPKSIPAFLLLFVALGFASFGRFVSDFLHRAKVKRIIKSLSKEEKA